MKARRFILMLVLLIGLVGCTDDDGDGGTAPPSTGTIVINHTPADLDGAGWSLTGPEIRTGSGAETLTDMPPGEYTLTWGDVVGWSTPGEQSQTLDAGGTITFTGTYVPVAFFGTIVINHTPADLDGAGWSLTGPEIRTGSGAETLTDMPPGEYTLTWVDVVGWYTPGEQSQTLSAGGTVVFNGIYTVDYSEYFVYIAPGVFEMGSPPEEPGHDSDHEAPQHLVTLTRGFHMSRFEVTEKWWAEVMDETPTTSQLPKASLSWDMAVGFCNMLSVQEGRTPAYEIHGPNGDVTWHQDADGYRLPTEAEWEYACRAGSTTAFTNGPITYTDCAPLDPNLDVVGWYCGNQTGAADFAEVGQKQANNWGLYDMHGNLWEWVWCGLRPYTSEAQVDPVHDVEPGFDRVRRGGSVDSFAYRCRAAFRIGARPGHEVSSGGLRLVRTATVSSREH